MRQSFVRPKSIRWLWWITSCGALLLAIVGCKDRRAATCGQLDVVWGRRGISDGRLQKPRGIAIDANDEIYLVDMTARIQVFDADGNFLRGWQTPEHELGRPTGLSIDRAGRVLVADTHYFRVLVYSPKGELLHTLRGGRGGAPGQVGWVTDVAEDAAGNWFVSEYGEYDRVQKFASDGSFVLEFGGHGDEPGRFSRPQCVTVDEQQRVWVCDSCNHRIQVFDNSGRWLLSWGQQGSQAGELSYPYSLVHGADGTVYVCEYGNHRVQHFTRDGQSLGCWGTHGRGPGELHNPWSVAFDSRGRLFVLDTNNHRVQRVTVE